MCAVAENALILARHLLHRNFSFCENPFITAFSDKKQNRNFVSKLRFGFGGRGWIRTTEAISSRFTVCPLWPLGNSPILYGTSELVPPGAGDGTRTRNLLITNQLLCQLSYTSILSFYGGSYRARTCDPLLVRQMLSQLS